MTAERDTEDGKRLAYKFQHLTVYHVPLGYLDLVYDLSRNLPAMERLNLRSRLQQAGTSVVLNITEGSTGQSDGDQKRFLGLRVRPYPETVACLDTIEQRGCVDTKKIDGLRQSGHGSFIGLLGFRQSLRDPVIRPLSAVSSRRSPISCLPSPVEDSP